MTGEPTWVIGAGGLLGRAVVKHLRGQGRAVMSIRVPWSDERATVDALSAGLEELAERAAGGGWRILWCAGTGVPATPADVLDVEERVLRALLDEVAGRIGRGLSASGAVFLASSAGAVYAGSADPPYDERTEARPLAHYGEAKLAQEQVVRAFTERTGVPSFIGRISNLYGPGQDLSKAQGLISHLCRAYLTGQPTSIYVSMDTIRDYIYVTDCAAKIADGIELARAGSLATPSTTKIIASQQGVTLGAVLGQCRRVFRRPPRVVLGASPLSSVQARDLRLRSVVETSLDARPLTTLGSGIRATTDDLALAMQRSQI